MENTSVGSLVELQQQIEDLQSRMAYQEELLHSLNSVVATQDKSIMQLNQQLRLQQNKLDNVSFNQESSGAEKPPHY
ncbi:MAG: SlyX protein [Cellvibrionaceae bacterium]|jgi:SlyX protein